MDRINNPQVKEVLEKLLFGNKEVLKDNFFGMYVFGSLASGDFNEETSDIDFVVVTKEDISPDVQAELEEMNKHVLSIDNKWTEKLERSFLPLHVFKDFNPTHTMYPSISTGGEYGLDHKGIEEPIQRFMLREDGIIWAGPDPKTFLDPISSEELKAATLEILQGWWESQLTDTHRIKDREYQAYAVVTMCRMLYTIKNGKVVSKPFAARWVMETSDDERKGLIERALNWKQGDGVDDLKPTLELIKFTLEQAK